MGACMPGCVRIWMRVYRDEHIKKLHLLFSKSFPEMKPGIYRQLNMYFLYVKYQHILIEQSPKSHSAL